MSCGCVNSTVLPRGLRGPEGPPGPDWDLLSLDFDSDGILTLTTDKPDSVVTTKFVWLGTGNSKTDPATDFLGTTDAQPLVLKTNNTERGRILSSGEFGYGTNSPAHFVDIVKQQNDITTVNILNNSGGTSSSSRFRLSNGSTSAVFQYFGSAYTTSGMNVANGLLIQNSGVGGLSIATTQAASEIRFYTGGTTQRGVITSSGGFGWGITSGLSALVDIQGTGTTSATYNFMTKNSSGTKIIKCRDDGRVGLGTNDAYLYAHFTIEGSGSSDYYYHSKLGDIKFYSGYESLGGTYGILDAGGTAVCRINSDFSTYDFLNTGRNYGLGTTDASTGKFTVSTAGDGVQISFQSSGVQGGYIGTHAEGGYIHLVEVDGINVYNKMRLNSNASEDYIATGNTLIITGAQAATVTPTGNTNALIDLQSTTKALLIMRMTATEASAITAANGMLLYVTSTNGTFTSVGFWGYEAGTWTKL